MSEFGQKAYANDLSDTVLEMFILPSEVKEVCSLTIARTFLSKRSIFL